MSWPLVRYVLTGFRRDRLFLALISLFLTGVVLSLFFGASAVIERDQFSLVFIGASLRACGGFFLIIFIAFFIRRSFEARLIELFLSRPLSRNAFIFSHSLAFSFLAVLISLIQGAALYLAAPHLFSQGSMLWIFSILAENLIIVHAALFFASALSSPAAAIFASAGFYILARMTGHALGIIDAKNALYDQALLEKVMEVISMFLPRLDLMGQTSWLIYGAEGTIDGMFILLQAVLYSALLLLATLIDFTAKEF